LNASNYQVVIGLEVHAQLQTESKLFSNEPTHFGSDPNSQVGEITLALPGTLPKVNQKAIELAIRMGLACGCEINRYQIFDRKNYFYPDLPKGYQITQHRTPACVGGGVPIKTAAGERLVKLHHIHLEEDAGKSMHLDGEEDTVIDLNRAGVPLIEIVSQPDLFSAEEAGAFLAEVRKLVRYLDVCDGNMEEGSLRCDANISVRLKTDTDLGKKVEVKNMNSIKNLMRAIQFETERQITHLEAGQEIVSETRTFEATSGKTFSMRTKETLNDYRYFPDPDLSPVVVSADWLNQIRSAMPELPQQQFEKLVTRYQLPEYDARLISEEKSLALYFEAVAASTTKYKAIANWLMGPVKEFMNANPDSFIPVPTAALARLIDLIDQGQISFTVAAQRLFPELIAHPHEDVWALAQRLDVVQNNNTEALLSVIREVIREFPLKVEEYKNGKKAIVTMFMGEVMKRTQGKADPKKSSALIVEALNNS
jgi:aspartyl-tRNA(Asn)/glutamyl-tRNA(Gln) amidotransferase subunit B